MKKKSSLLLPVSIGILAGFALQGSFILGLHFKPILPEPINIYSAPIEETTVTITAFTARKEECNNNPSKTAIMTTPTVGRTIACSRDLIHWLGGWIYIEGVGVRKVECLMNKRFTQRLDILVGTVKNAQTWGIQERHVIFLGR